MNSLIHHIDELDMTGVPTPILPTVNGTTTVEETRSLLEEVMALLEEERALLEEERFLLEEARDVLKEARDSLEETSATTSCKWMTMWSQSTTHHKYILTANKHSGLIQKLDT